jgi:hypothetical protein
MSEFNTNDWEVRHCSYCAGKMECEGVLVPNIDDKIALAEARGEARGMEKVIEEIPERNEFGQAMFIDYIDPRYGRQIVKSMLDIKRELKSKFLTNSK